MVYTGMTESEVQKSLSIFLQKLYGVISWTTQGTGKNNRKNRKRPPNYQRGPSRFFFNYVSSRSDPVRTEFIRAGFFRFKIRPFPILFIFNIQHSLFNILIFSQTFSRHKFKNPPSPFGRVDLNVNYFGK